MKFVLNHEGVLEPAKENIVKEVVVRYAKPVLKIVVIGAVLYVGFHGLQLFLGMGLPGVDFAIHEVMQFLGLGNYFPQAFHAVSQAVGF